MKKSAQNQKIVKISLPSYIAAGICFLRRGLRGGSLAEISQKAMNKDVGLLVNVSRDIIFASSGIDFATVAGEKAKAYAAEMSLYL